MNLEKIREYCLSLPHVTEEVSWEKDLVFKIGGKMFEVIGLDAGPAGNSRSNARRKSSPN